VKHTFTDGSTLIIPSYFVEFAERKNGREGFECQNADAIFDSTTHESR
jgi:4-hydroxyphenylpyruvate dioxygenase-like putative hemolysin